MEDGKDRAYCQPYLGYVLVAGTDAEEDDEARELQADSVPQIRLIPA